jgi:hypothetical protein
MISTMAASPIADGFGDQFKFVERNLSRVKLDASVLPRASAS